jgi:hypothetical protein
MGRPKAPQGCSKDHGQEHGYRHGQQDGLRRSQIRAIYLFENMVRRDPHLSNCLGIVAGDDDAGFSFDRCRRGDFRLFNRTQGQTKKCGGYRTGKGDYCDLEMG